MFQTSEKQDSENIQKASVLVCVWNVNQTSLFQLKMLISKMNKTASWSSNEVKCQKR